MLRSMIHLPIIKRIQKSWNSQSASGSIFRNMAVLASGAAMARAIGVLSMPVITRIYEPEHMGVLSVYVAFAALLAPFGTFRYTSAIPLPRREETAFNLVALCCITLISVSALIGLILALSARQLLPVLSMEPLLPYWWLLPITIIGRGAYEILQHWAIRTKSFKVIRKTRLNQSLIGASTKILLGLLGLRPLGLLIGYIFLQTGGIVTFTRSFWSSFTKHRASLSPKTIRFMALRYAEFPKYRLPSQFLLVLATKAPLFYFASQFGKETTGQLGLALGMIALPMALFGQSTSQAYFAEIAKIGKKQPQQIAQISKSIVKKLALVSIGPFLTLLVAGPFLFSIVFGAQWRTSGIFASILSFYLVAQFISSPLVNALTVFNRQDLFFKTNILRLAGIIIVFGVSYLFKLSAASTLMVYTAMLALHYVFTSLLTFHIMRQAKYLQDKLNSE